MNRQRKKNQKLEYSLSSHLRGTMVTCRAAVRCAHVIGKTLRPFHSFELALCFRICICLPARIKKATCRCGNMHLNLKLGVCNRFLGKRRVDGGQDFLGALLGVSARMRRHLNQGLCYLGSVQNNGGTLQTTTRQK